MQQKGQEKKSRWIEKNPKKEQKNFVSESQSVIFKVSHDQL